MKISNCNTPQNTAIPVFVAHVKNGYDARKTHIEQMLAKLGLDFEFMLDGDIADIDQAVLDKWFAGSMHQATPATSCALKHLLIYEEIIRRNLEGALILEDDIVLSDKRFNHIFTQSLKELENGDLWDTSSPILISYEDTRLRFVERSRRKKGYVLYRGDRDRMTGAYYINRAAACAMLEYAGKNPLPIPIDGWHRYLLDQNIINYLWCQPTVATQGSFIGKFQSSISPRGSVNALKWRFKRFYKRILYHFR